MFIYQKRQFVYPNKIGQKKRPQDILWEKTLSSSRHRSERYCQSMTFSEYNAHLTHALNRKFANGGEKYV